MCTKAYVSTHTYILSIYKHTFYADVCILSLMYKGFLMRYVMLFSSLLFDPVLLRLIIIYLHMLYRCIRVYIHTSTYVHIILLNHSYFCLPNFGFRVSKQMLLLIFANIQTICSQCKLTKYYILT